MTTLLTRDVYRDIPLHINRQRDDPDMPVPPKKPTKSTPKPPAKAPPKKAGTRQGNVGRSKRQDDVRDAPAVDDSQVLGKASDPLPQAAPIEEAHLPVIHVQEAAVPAPLTMREASQMGVAVITANSAIARQITASAKSSDLDELGKGLTGLMVAAQEYDPSKLNRWGIVRFFRKKKAVIEGRMKTVDENVTMVLKECDRQVRLMDQRIGNLEGLYEENTKLYASLGEEIERAEARIAESEANLPEVDPSDTHSIQERSRAESAILFARKRVEDLRSARALSLLQGPQIQLMAENCYNVIQGFGTLKETTIPTLQRQYAAYVVQTETKRAVEFASAVRKQTNDALVANAKSLHKNTIESNEALGQSLVSIETLQLVHKELIDGIADVTRIRADMVQRMNTDAPRIEAMNTQINQSLQLTHQTA